MSVMLSPCILCVALLMYLFVLCVVCLTVFVNCLLKQFEICLGVVVILLFLPWVLFMFLYVVSYHSLRAGSQVLLVVSLHQSDPLSDTFFCDIVVNNEIIKRACLSLQRALEEMLHRLISFFTITRGVILICIFPLF